MYSVYPYPLFSTLRPFPGLMIRTQVGISSIDARVTNITGQCGSKFEATHPCDAVIDARTRLLGLGLSEKAIHGWNRGFYHALETKWNESTTQQMGVKETAIVDEVYSNVTL